MFSSFGGTEIWSYFFLWDGMLGEIKAMLVGRGGAGGDDRGNGLCSAKIVSREEISKESALGGGNRVCVLLLYDCRKDPVLCSQKQTHEKSKKIC